MDEDDPGRDDGGVVDSRRRRPRPTRRRFWYGTIAKEDALRVHATVVVVAIAASLLATMHNANTTCATR